MSGPLRELQEKVVDVIDNFAMIRYLPLNIEDEETQENLMMQIDSVVQYMEYQLPKENYPDEVDPEDDNERE